MKLAENLEPLTVYDFDASEPIRKLVLAVLEAIPDTCAEEFPSFSAPYHGHVAVVNCVNSPEGDSHTSVHC